MKHTNIPLIFQWNVYGEQFDHHGFWLSNGHVLCIANKDISQEQMIVPVHLVRKVICECKKIVSIIKNPKPMIQLNWQTKTHHILN